MLPGSIFATAGARAMGDAGRMPHGHKEVAGLQIAYEDPFDPARIRTKTPPSPWLGV